MFVTAGGFLLLADLRMAVSGTMVSVMVVRR
jgi:hypothetical protein